MNSRERVFAALHHQAPDRVPRFEIWIDAFLDDLGGGDAQAAFILRAGSSNSRYPDRPVP